MTQATKHRQPTIASIKAKIKKIKENTDLHEGDFWHPDPDEDARYDRSNRRQNLSLNNHPVKPSITNNEPRPSAPAKENKFSTMQSGTAKLAHHESIEDAHLHAHLQAVKTKQPHAVIHNGVKVATHSFVNGEHHVEIH